MADCKNEMIPEEQNALSDERTAGRTKRPVISRNALHAIMKTMPAPILEHSRRCKQLAIFALERLAAEEWFLELSLSEENLAAAVYFHDIGKSRVSREDLYLSKRPGAEKRERYLKHTNTGLGILTEQLGQDPLDAREGSFERLAAEAVCEHHEQIDGKGLSRRPEGSGISFAGRLTAAVDRLDNLLFPEGYAAESLDRAVEQMREEAGTGLDERLVEALVGDRRALDDYAATLMKSWDRKRKEDRYGIRYRYSPILALDRMGDRDLGLAYLIAEPVIYDIYYGEIRLKVFKAAAEESDRIFSFERLALEKLFRTLRDLNRAGLAFPPVVFELSLREFVRPGFGKFLEKLFKDYRLDEGSLIIGLREPDITAFGLAPEMLAQEIHNWGCGLAILDFGKAATVLPSFGAMKPGLVIFEDRISEKLREDAAARVLTAGTVNSLKALETDTVLPDIRNSRETETARELGISHGTGLTLGERFGEGLSDREIIAFLKEVQDAP